MVPYFSEISVCRECCIETVAIAKIPFFIKDFASRVEYITMKRGNG